MFSKLSRIIFKGRQQSASSVEICKAACSDPATRTRRIQDNGFKLSSDYCSENNGSSLRTLSWSLLAGIGVYEIYDNRARVSEAVLSVLPAARAAIKVEDNLRSHNGGRVRPSQKHACNFVADAVQKVLPAVVFITTTNHHPSDQSRFIPASTGSGFIVEPNGVIVTNAHIVANKAKVMVALSDGRVLPGSIQFLDDLSDLATIKVDAANLPTVKLASSSSVRSGEFVVAIGSPHSLINTTTFGIVSSVGRTAKELGLNKQHDYIQTDAAINIGNSGGPLVDMDGEAIGVNTIKVAEGIAIAIPSDTVKDFLRRTKEEKTSSTLMPFFRSSSPTVGDSVSRPVEPMASRRKTIGVTMMSLTAGLVEQMRALNPKFPTVSSGVVIMKVNDNSPGQQCGLRPQDIVVKVNGRPVDHVNELLKHIQTEEKLVLDVLREDKVLRMILVPR